MEQFEQALQHIHPGIYPDIIQLILSFCPYDDLCARHLQDTVFARGIHFFLRRPKPMFHQTIWYYRIHICNQLGVVLYGSHILHEKIEVTARLRHAFSQFLAITGHCQCESALHKLVTNHGQLLANERDFLLQHFADIWLSRFATVLVTKAPTELILEGIQYIILAINLKILEDDAFSRIHLHIFLFFQALIHNQPVMDTFFYPHCRDLFTRIFYLGSMHRHEDVRTLSSTLQTYLQLEIEA